MVETSESKWNGRGFSNGLRWKWLGLLAFIVVLVIVVAGLATSCQSSKPSASGLCNDKLTQMEQNGNTQVMLQQHQNMMEQMRVGLSPQMQQLMDNDPMWKLMRSADFTQMMQDQQQQIDRSLAAAATCGAP